MSIFRSLYRIAAVFGMGLILVKVFDVSFSLWWFIPLAMVVWVITEIRASYVKSMMERKEDSNEQAPFVDLKKETDGTWKRPSESNE